MLTCVASRLIPASTCGRGRGRVVAGVGRPVGGGGAHLGFVKQLGMLGADLLELDRHLAARRHMLPQENLPE